MAAPIEENAAVQNTCNINFYNHPKYEELVRLGVTDHSLMRLTLLTYLDLTENKGWWNVRVLCGGQGAPVLVGHESRRRPPQLLVPIAGETGLSVSRMKTMAQSAQKILPDADSVIAAIVDSDSSISYLRVAAGLLPPPPPDELEAKAAKRKRQEERKKQRFVCIHRDAVHQQHEQQQHQQREQQHEQQHEQQQHEQQQQQHEQQHEQQQHEQQQHEQQHHEQQQHEQQQHKQQQHQQQSQQHVAQVEGIISQKTDNKRTLEPTSMDDDQNKKLKNSKEESEVQSAPKDLGCHSSRDDYNTPLAEASSDWSNAASNATHPDNHSNREQSDRMLSQHYRPHNPEDFEEELDNEDDEFADEL